MSKNLNPKIKYPKDLAKTRPFKYVKFLKIPSTRYSSPYDFKVVIKNYLNLLKKDKITTRTLILCHGHLHPRYQYLDIKHSILVDINPLSVPDLIGDIRSNAFMNRFPANFFDVVYLLYTPPPAPLAPANQFIWSSIHRLLKPKGVMKSRYIIDYYFKHHRRLDYFKLIAKYFKGHKYQVSFHGKWTHLVPIK